MNENLMADDSFNMKTSPWIVDSHCAFRLISEHAPELIENRIAFIEKSPRVRVSPYTKDNDFENWKYGPKGSGGCDTETDLTYGFDSDSRQWCDEQLIILGYTLG